MEYDFLKKVADSIPAGSPWTLTDALPLYDALTKEGHQLPPLGWFFHEVQEYRKKTPAAKKANHAVCQDKHHPIVFLETIYDLGKDSEFPDGLDTYYCPVCNAFWREP